MHVGGEIRAVFAARVLGVRGKRRTRSARVLPDAAALIPMESETPKRIGHRALIGEFEPNPFPDNLGQFILLRQLCPQQLQDPLRGQFAVVIVFDPFD